MFVGSNVTLVGTYGNANNTPICSSHPRSLCTHGQLLVNPQNNLADDRAPITFQWHFTIKTTLNRNPVSWKRFCWTTSLPPHGLVGLTGLGTSSLANVFCVSSSRGVLIIVSLCGGMDGAALWNVVEGVDVSAKLWCRTVNSVFAPVI